jgi:outer membrane protein assembly factor BamB
VANYAQGLVASPLDNKQLAAMKAALAKDRRNARLKEEIRNLDFQLRTEHFRRQGMGQRGGWLLLAGGAIFALGLKSAVTLRRRLPRPKAQALAVAADARLATIARWSVAAVAVVIAGGAGALAMRVGGVAPAPTTVEESTFPALEEVRRNWPSFRGPGGQGISAYTNVPTAWNGKTGEGILWKTPVPLPGENSPVVWGNRVFLTGADKNKRAVYCFDADSGKLLWTGPVEGIPGSPATPPRVPEETGYACPTAVTDGQRVYAIFANGDVAAFDYTGRRAWARNLGVAKSTYGYTSSLSMYQNRVLVLVDQTPVEEGRSKLLALDSGTGRTAWEARRPVRDSWASPVCTTLAGREQVLTIGDPWFIAYDPASGKELWRSKCLGGDVAPSPVGAGGLAMAVQPYAKLVAIRADGQGDVTETHTAWKFDESIPDICSPLATGDFVMLLMTNGLLTCVDAKSGKKIWEKDLDTECRASPALVGDRVYLLVQSGTMVMFEAGRQYKELGRAELGEKADASPAFLDGRIYIRGLKHLFGIGKK